MVDSLNAEVSLGTIANVPEAIQWLGYTYLFSKYSEVQVSNKAHTTVRMRKEPFIYGETT